MTGSENITSGGNVGPVLEYEITGLSESKPYYFSVQAVQGPFVSDLSVRTRAFVGGGGWLEETNFAPWQGRTGHQVVEYNGWLWLMGGINKFDEYLNDVWRTQDGVSWQAVTDTAGWQPRAGHRVAVFNGKMWLVGGYSDESLTQNYSNFDSDWWKDAWSSTDGETWTKATLSGDSWVGRRDHALLVHDDKIWILGGEGPGGGLLNDVYSSSDGSAWSVVNSSANWSPRSKHASVSFDGKLWVFGSDLWTSSDDGLTWQSESAPWGNREDFTVIVVDGELWLLGGEGANGDFWKYSSDLGWRPELANAPWGDRSGAGVLFFDGRVWVIGGQTGSSDPYRDVWSFDVPPIVVIDTPSEDLRIDEIDTSLDFSGQASDDQPISSVEFRVNGGVWYAAEGTETWSFNTGDRLRLGPNWVEVRAFTVEGDVSSIKRRLVSRGIIEVEDVYPLLNAGFEDGASGWQRASESPVPMMCGPGTSRGIMSTVHFGTGNFGLYQDMQIPAYLLPLVQAGRLGVRVGGTVVHSGGPDIAGNFRLDLYRSQPPPNMDNGSEKVTIGQDFVVTNTCTSYEVTTPLTHEVFLDTTWLRFIVVQNTDPFFVDDLILELIELDDNQLPTVAVGSPSISELILPQETETFQFTGTAIDPDGAVTEVHYRVNDGDWVLADGQDTWTFTLGVTSGIFRVYIRALDNEGAFSPTIERLLITDVPESDRYPLVNAGFESGMSGWQRAGPLVPQMCGSGTSQGVTTTRTGNFGFYQDMQIPADLLPLLRAGGLKVRVGGTVVHSGGPDIAGNFRLDLYRSQPPPDTNNEGEKVTIGQDFVVTNTCTSYEVTTPLTHEVFLDTTWLRFIVVQNTDKPFFVDDLILELIRAENIASVDTDNDGLTDGEEASLGTNPSLWDTDGDGFGDGYEYDISTDPTVAGDKPAALVVVWVELGRTDVLKGTQDEPVAKIGEALGMVASGGIIKFANDGDSTETPIIDQDVTISATSGIVRIGV